MESADLRVFQAVAREGSITKAALLLGYVQSNVTARIRHLESELGTVLFHRHHRGITLSSSGKMLLTYADKIVGLLDEAAQALTPSSEPSGPLLIGSTQTTAAVRLPTLLGKYYEQHPKVILSLMTDLSNKLIEKVLHYDLDVAFINNPCNHPDLQTIPAFNEEVVLVSAPWVTEIEEALTKPNLVYSKGCPYRETLEQWLHSRGVSHLNTMEFGTLEAIIGGVSAGLGITLLPRVVVHKQEKAGAVRVHEVPEEIRYRQTVIIIRSNSFTTSALQAFIQMIEVEEGIHS